MEFSTGRLQASTRIQERSSGNSAEERRQHAPRRHKEDPLADDEALTQDDTEGHQLDDLA